MKQNAGKGDLAFCSIISKNYLGYARALAESLRGHHAGAALFVLLLDPPDGFFQPSAEPFTLLSLEAVFRQDAPRFRFQYTPFELSCAAKPYLIAHLFENYGIRKLAYFDSDILVLHNLQHLERLLDDHSIILTPHLTAPYDDDKYPSEQAILQSGSYNMGFVAVKKGPASGAFLAWWKQRLDRGCLNAVERGMFVDQKWVDLAPGLFADVCILRDPGYNVAYWNLHSRTVTERHGSLSVEGSPCYFFHFSGFDPADEQSVSKHQNRFALSDLGEVRHLLERYRNQLKSHGHFVIRHWPYTWGVFDNGVAIHDLVRREYHRLGAAAAAFGNPFAAAGGKSFFTWLTSAEGTNLPPLLKAIYEARPDVRQCYPDAANKDRTAFQEWALTQGLREMHFDPAFATAVRSALANPAAHLSGIFAGRGGPVTESFGINILGYVQSEKGMGEACRSTVRSLAAVKIPCALQSLTDIGSTNRDDSLVCTTENPYPVNLFHTNADAIPDIARLLPWYFQGRYNIGYWNWELEWFPEKWAGSFEFFDEIWAPSTFTQRSFARVSPIPVHWVPLSISVPPATPADLRLARAARSRFGLPAGAFVFLFVFDFHSIFARKNPLAVIEAFRLAFPRRRDVVLAIKPSRGNSAPMEFAEVLTACQGRPNIRLIQEILDRPDMFALLRSCDAYVALHRSEGYGLPLAEAMALGKPVIATDYSGNVDFMNETNSFPVRYKLVAIDKDHGPYRRGAEWADPDVDHAAEQMRRVVEAPALTAQRTARARADIERLLSPHAVGQVIRRRLNAILHRSSPAGTAQMVVELERRAA
jgi:glycosyltransferase involved in cell wall biosynthesis